MEIVNTNTNKWKSIFTFVPVFIIVYLAIIIKYRLNTSVNYLLIGGDGPYYPLQVKSLIQHFHLAFSDMPLLFVIEALLAKILLLFNYGTLNECVLASVLYTDAIIPAFAAIPVYLIAKLLFTNGLKEKVVYLILITYAVINLTTIRSFSGGLQKNAAALLWVFLYFYYIIRVIKYSQKKDAYYALLILVLCALTHFGSFSILLFLSLLIGISWVLYHKKGVQKWTFKKTLLIVITIGVGLRLIAFFDVDRFQRLIHIPLKIFQFPIIALLINGYQITNYISPFDMLIINPLAIYASIILILYRKQIHKDYKALLVAFIISALLLTSPLLGLEWANRLFIMGYIPIVMTYLILFSQIKTIWIKIFPCALFLLIIVISTIFSFESKNSCISDESYTEFKTLNIKEPLNHKTIVVGGRQDLRLLAGWEFGMETSADYLFKKQDFKKYDGVYIIRQISGSNFDKERPRGDAEIPMNSVLVFKGTYFELYKLKNDSLWINPRGKPLKAFGIVEKISESSFTLKNKSTGKTKTILFSKQTQFNLLDKSSKLKTGMLLDIYGEWKAFSLDIDAEIICEK